mgnify:CR=1 FL=1
MNYTPADVSTSNPVKVKLDLAVLEYATTIQSFAPSIVKLKEYTPDIGPTIYPNPGIGYNSIYKPE